MDINRHIFRLCSVILVIYISSGEAAVSDYREIFNCVI